MGSKKDSKRKKLKRQRATRRARAHVAKQSASDEILQLMRQGEKMILRGNTQESVSVFQKVLELEENHAGAWHRLGIAAAQLGDRPTAVDLIKRSIQLDPRDHEALGNLGVILKYLDRRTEAAECLRAAIRLNGNIPNYHVNLGMALDDLGQLDEALACQRRALALRPDYGLCLNHLVRLLSLQCAWEERDQHLKTLLTVSKQDMERGNKSSLMPFWALTLPITMEQQKVIARSWGRHFASSGDKVPFTFERSPRERLRIGYVSPDFSSHAVGFVLQDLFSFHDRDAVEVFGFSIRDVKDTVNETIRGACDHFVALTGRSDQDAARVIYEHKIDILVDLAGYTALARPSIFAMEPAPVQCHYLGYPGTLGADHVQYFLTHRDMVPEGWETHYDEKLVLFPDSPYALPDFGEISGELTRGDVGLPEDAIVFACFNQPYRYDARVFDSWARILDRVPEGVLWLQAPQGATQENLRAAARDRGIEQHRLVFAEPERMSTNWRHRLADLWLDTFSLPGGTAGVLCAWVGLPVVTLAGERTQDRNGATVARALGLPELVVERVQDYEDRAVHLAHNPKERADLSRRLIEAKRTSHLFQPKHLVRHLERAYELMWERYEKNLPPAAIQVPRIRSIDKG